MATVTLYSRNIARANRMISYACAKQIPGDPISSELCSAEPESAKRQFYAVREEHFSGCAKPFAEMVHSFSPEESQRITPELVNKIGHELATTMFPGHQALVVTHLDRDHYHNHIFINRYHSKTGKLTRDDLNTVRKLRSVNDQICKSYGLSIPQQAKQERQARVPKKVAQMIKVGRFSYLADTMQKADFARAIATSYSEYQNILGEFGIKVRIEPKNIAYTYPGQSVAKRGKTMGALYDKAGLEAAFKSNDEKFQQHPQLRAMLATGLEQLKASNRNTKGVIDVLSTTTDGHVVRGVKDYSKFTYVPRRAAGWARASDEDLIQRSVPLDEMRKARRSNIIDYCRKNDIALVDKGGGSFVLKERPYVELSDYEWANKKNKTRGNLIDLVAAHKGISFLEAIAEINGNKRLLLLQQAGGDAKRSYTSFYLPKPERESGRPALQHLAALLGHHGAREEFAAALLKSGQAQVAKSGMVRLFAKDHDSGTYEFVRESEQKWSKSQKGMFTKPFFAQAGTGRKALIYTNPFVFMAGRRQELFPSARGADGVLVLMHQDATQVDHFLSGHRNVDSLRIVISNPKHPSQTELDFFHNLKNRYASFGIQLEYTALERVMPERSLGRER